MKSASAVLALANHKGRCDPMTSCSFGAKLKTGQLPHQSDCILLVTHLSSSFSLLSLSKSLSFLTCMGALGTNHAAMNLHMTTTCCGWKKKARNAYLFTCEGIFKGGIGI